MDAPRGAVPHTASRRSAHAGREVEKSLRLFRAVVLSALAVLVVGLLLAIASLPDERSTAPAQVGPASQYSRSTPSTASRSLTRPPLARSVAVGVNRPLPIPAQGVTSAVLQTASRTPAAVPSRPAPTATEHLTSSSAQPPLLQTVDAGRQITSPRSVATGSPAAVSVGGTASGPTASQWATLRRCESGGLYGNKQNPRYRGAYQIGFTEWANYGGTKPYGDPPAVYTDPADAPPSLQDLVALRMWQARGWQPWSSSSKCTGLS